MKVFVISLPEAQERRRSAARQLLAHGIAFEFFDAVTGGEALAGAIEGCRDADWLLNTGRIVTAAEIGCFASHRALWRHCAAQCEPLLILEDDFRVLDGFGAAVEEVRGLVGACGFVRLQSERRAKHRSVRTCGRFRLVRYTKAPHSMMCYAISPDVAARFAALTRVIDAPVDVFVKRFWEHQRALYGLMPYTIAESPLCEATCIPGRCKSGKTIATAARRLLRKCEWEILRWHFNRTCAFDDAGYRN